MTNTSLSRLILTVYTPTSGGAIYWSFKNAPPWISSDRWDIEARIADADRTRWQDQDQQPEMLRTMLQQLLMDRYHLAVHRASHEGAGLFA